MQKSLAKERVWLLIYPRSFVIRWFQSARWCIFYVYGRYVEPRTLKSRPSRTSKLPMKYCLLHTRLSGERITYPNISSLAIVQLGGIYDILLFTFIQIQYHSKGEVKKLRRDGLI